MKTIEIVCQGVTPILFNRMTAEALEGLRTKTKRAKNAERPATPRLEATPKVYTTKDGVPYIPAEMLFSCLVEAGRLIRLEGKKMVSNANSTTLPSFLTLTDRYLPLFVPGTTVHPSWEVDVRQGRNPNGGEAVCICRPRFDEWEFVAHVLIDTDVLGERTVRDLWDKAGKCCGLGDFRPQRKGIQGQFIVRKWEAVDPLVNAAE